MIFIIHHQRNYDQYDFKRDCYKKTFQIFIYPPGYFYQKIKKSLKLVVFGLRIYI